MNRAVDRWFSQDVTEMRDDSNRMALQLAQYSSANARAEAESIAAALPTDGTGKRRVLRMARGGSKMRGLVQSECWHRHRITLQNGFAIVYREGHSIAAFHMPTALSRRPR